MKLEIEVKRRRFSVTQGQADVYVNGEMVISFGDPILKAHLVEICSALLELDANDAVVVMGRPDDKKLKSSMTLFDAASGHQEIFEKVLEKYYQGKKDRRTLQLLDMKNR